MICSIESQIFQWIYIIVTMRAATLVNTVKIKALHVPDTVILENINEPKPLYLDCDYELNPKEKGFVMKWYFNDQLVYQWIPDRQPLALNSFKNMIDLNTTVNRGILIREMSFNISGQYKCNVQTFESNDSKIGKLQIVVPEGDFILQHVTYRGMVFTRCEVTNIYPEPKLTILFGQDRLLDVSKKLVQGNDSLFNASILARVHSKQAMESPIVISCVLTIPNTSYMRKKESIFYDTNDEPSYKSFIDDIESYHRGVYQMNKGSKCSLFINLHIILFIAILYLDFLIS